MVRQHKKRRYFGQHGFTLVELVLALGIMGVLFGAAITLMNPKKQIDKAHDARRKGDLQKIQAALELYRADFSQYPTSLPNCGRPITDNGTPAKTYLQQIPCDPAGTAWYNGGRYHYASNGAIYTLTACIANTSDRTGTAGQPPGGGCGPNMYYQVRNP